jgi:hypothetical protein
MHCKENVQGDQIGRIFKILELPIILAYFFQGESNVLSLTKNRIGHLLVHF